MATEKTHPECVVEALVRQDLAAGLKIDLAGATPSSSPVAARLGLVRAEIGRRRAGSRFPAGLQGPERAGCRRAHDPFQRSLIRIRDGPASSYRGFSFP